MEQNLINWLKEHCQDSENISVKEIKDSFPEIFETEDEKIRKALVDMFEKKVEKGYEWVEYGIPNNSVLSWLKKTKRAEACGVE